MKKGGHKPEPAWSELETGAESLRQPKKQLREAQEPKKAPYIDCSKCPDVKVYSTDSPDGRAFLGLGPSDKCSDGVVWFQQPAPGRLVFVEIKCAYFQEADEQLESTIRAWKAKSAAACSCPTHAVVVLTGSAPADLTLKQKHFRRDTKVALHVLAGRTAHAKKKKQSLSSRRILCEEIRDPDRP